MKEFKNHTIHFKKVKDYLIVEYGDSLIDKDCAISIVKNRMQFIRKYGELNIIAIISKKTKFTRGANYVFGQKRGYIGIKNIAIFLENSNFLKVFILNLLIPNRGLSDKPRTKFFNSLNSATKWIEKVK